jgi:hypothetical protein
MLNYRKCKAQENETPQASTSSTLHHVQLYTIIAKPMSAFKRILLVIDLDMPAGGDCVQSPNTPSDDCKYFIFSNLAGYSPTVCKIFKFFFAKERL